MRAIILTTFLLLSSLVTNAFAVYHQEGQPDIVIQTNIDYNWSSFLIQKVTKYLSTTKIGDPTEKTLKEHIVIEDFIFPQGQKNKSSEKKSTDALVSSLREELSETLSPDSGKNIMDRLMANKGLKQAKFKITIENLGYKINRTALGITPEEETSDSLEAQVSIHIGNMLVKAENISIAIMLPIKGVYKNFVEFKMNRPFIKTPSSYSDERGISPTDIAFNFKLKVQKKDKQYGFSLIHSSFDEVQKFIDQNGDQIKFVPRLDVTPSPFPLLRLGNVVWILVKDKRLIEEKIKYKEFNVKNFLMEKDTFAMTNDEAKSAEVRFVDMAGYFKEHQNDIKALLFAEVFKIVSGGAGNDLLKRLETFKIDESSIINGGPIVAKMGLDKIGSNEEAHVIAKLSSGFCSDISFKTKALNCVEYTKPVRMISPSQLDQSMDDITTTIRNQEADLVVSISESYISHLLKTTFHAGMWTKALSAQPIEMNTKENPNFMFMVLDQKGNFGTLVMDADYVGLQWFEKLAVGKKRIRVALKYKVTIEVANKDGIPNLEITLADADYSDDVVLNGVPQWGVESEIKTVKRFKKLVIKEAADEIKAAIGTKIEIPIPELNSLGFSDVEYVRFASDGNGRANLLLKVKDSAKLRHVGPEKEKEQVNSNKLNQKPKRHKEPKDQ
ncbi:MAG: hypothetical protein ACOYL6_18970 [Bacteriovoracaceae bacterium]